MLVDAFGNGIMTVPGGVLRTVVYNAVAQVGGNDIDAQNYQSVSIQVSGTFVGTLAYEVSNDGTNWVAKNLVTPAGAIAATTAAASMWSADIGARYFRVRMSAYTSGAATVVMLFSGASQSNAISSVSATVGAAAGNIGKAEDAAAVAGDVGVQILGVRRDVPVVSASATGDYNEVAMSKHGALAITTIDSMKKTYAAAMKLTPIVGTNLEITGAAAGTVEINRITITLFATAAGVLDITLNKRSAASTVGTAVNLTKVPYDAADAAAAAAAVRVFSVAPTPGALVGPVRQAMLSVVASQASDRLRFESGSYAKSFTLTGVAQALTLDIAGTIPAGAAIAVDIEWTEVA